MRKIIYTKALIDLIAGCIFDGLTDEETSILSKVSAKTIQRLRQGEECPRIKEVTLERLRFYIRSIRDGNDRTNHWQRIAWFLERRYPDRWAKPEVLLNINSSGANVTNNTLVITAEQAQGLKIRNANLDEALSKLSPPANRTGPIIPIMSPEHIGSDVRAEEFLPNKEHVETTLSSSVVLAGEGAAPTCTPDAEATTAEPVLPPNSKILRPLPTEKKSVGIDSNYRPGIDPPLKKKPGAKKQEKNLENFNPPKVEKPQSLNSLAPLQALDKKPRGRPRRGTENVPRSPVTTSLSPAPRGPKSGRK